ncbi:response regulator [Curtobacterium sp. VKM Ac-1395]|uniref:response regulator n=1 Tax=Curtobacterium sp. VKM Ac-1395 TaxID=2783815 RepID=UPI00188D8A0A|nr:response regulator transcription factor [Curtobacterium sp. VKM Ac-1395]MBF4590821.1 response regulator transcription factor [Curtobacterium sp. VKM Ac-1395]
MTIRIVLADDQAMIRSGLALVLRSEPDLEIVEECADGHALVRAVTMSVPDLVLTDIRMPGVDGVEATRRIRDLAEGPPVLALTTFDDDDVLWPTLDAGANGFVLKDSAAEALVDAVRVVAGGGTWIDPRVLPRVVARAVAQPQVSADSARALASLTPRERDVLDLVCDGASNAEVAAALDTAERTVKSHVSAILAKLGARDRAGAIVIAHRAGWRRG